ncbi:MAG: S8 family peptidase, partial [Gammaproteobacteria bacterium]|nr:S8 family peptidase [Gammaproteobacteria bacterium]
AAQDVREADEPETSEQRTAHSKMSGPVAALARAGGQQPADLIVSYDEHPELFEDGRIESLGGEVIRHYKVLKLLAVRLPADSLVELAIDEKVDRVSLDGIVAATSSASRRAAKSPVYPSNNSTFRGSNIGIAVLDSGVAYHTDIRTDIHQYSFLQGAFPHPEIDDGEVESYNSSARGDGYGHGTHVAGIIAGSGKGSSGRYKGPASGSKILSLKVLDDTGQGSMSDVMAALDWLLKYGSYFDIRVANLSLGKPITESNTTDPLVLAVEQLWDSGIVVAVAAGNYGREGYFSITSPGNSRKVITVGSLTDNNTGDDYSDDYVSTYSSRGPSAGDHVSKPDLVAPGNRLIAASPKESYLEKLLPELVVSCTYADTCEDNYMTMSGTSMATPLVAAAAAMMLDKDSTLSPATVKARLMRSAQKLDESPVVGGAGLLDIEAALDETGVVDGEALSPLLVYDEETGGTLMEDTSALWGDDVWGAGYMWTDGGVSANGALWTDGGVSANGFIWTDGGVNANGYIWTDGSIWAHGALWTDGGIAAFGYMWTDGGINANGYLWTDGVNANGYIWTDGLRALALWDLDSANPAMNDDEQPVDVD